MKASCLFYFVCAAAMAPAGTIFSVAGLGNLGGSAAQALGLNAGGEAVGSAVNSFGYSHAFSNFGGGISDLTLNTGASEGSAESVNSSGQIAGTQYINGQPVATIWNHGSPQVISGTGSYGTAINDAGATTGMLANGHAFSASNGLVTDLGVFGGGNWSSGYAIDNSGRIAGYGQTASGAFRGFLWTPSTGYVQIGTLGGQNSYAMGIDDAGQIVGNAQLSNGYSHAFLWSQGAMQDLGTLGLSSYAYGINASGDVVGYSYVNGEAHAFLYQNGMMLDLNTLIDPSTGWLLTQAYAINASGQIAGAGIFNGVEQAFRLDPISANSAVSASTAAPEPATWVIAAIGLVFLLGSRIRFRPRQPQRRRDRTPAPPQSSAGHFRPPLSERGPLE